MPIATSNGVQAGTKVVRSEMFYPARDIIPTALVYQLATNCGTIEGDEPVVSIPIIMPMTAAEIIAEGEEIPETDALMQSIDIRTYKVSILSAASNEIAVYGNTSDEIQDMLGAAMIKAIVDKADAILLQNTPTTDSEGGRKGPAGLFNAPGITTGYTITTGNTIPNTLGPLVDALAAVAAKGARPTHLVMNFATWAKLLNLKYADGRPIIAPDVANSPAPVIYGVPVVINAQAPDDKILINDSNVVYAAVSQVRAASSDHDKFRNDAVTFRTTFRFGFGSTNPERLAVVDIAAATTGKGA
ncbi:phage major capsid protein [Bifidobacterium aerophilum]|uniref:Phage major capsid protein n=1 Tax=Bifidobacterium aerophilum TaxID=1798155 RepID=A0A6N9Z2A8_9BIFI|nr:phage major capsid protein [Bifidobacterium aerophilum]NEG88606.1 phage major capsid protein [Bifidobacterium aerophilum]